MEEALKKEIQRLKEELARKKEEVQDIAQLVGKVTDRPFELDPRELSERELEAFVREKLITLKQHIDISPDPKALSSHRKIIGRPILFLKRKFMKMIRFYTQLIASKQTKFNENSAALFEAIFTRSRRNRQELLELQDRISQLEEAIVLLAARLQNLKESVEKAEYKIGAMPREGK